MMLSQTEIQIYKCLLENLQKLLGTYLNLSTAFHPQTDGQTERMNSTLEDMLRHYMSPDQKDWDNLLSLAEFSMNRCYKSSIDCSPFQLVYGKNPRTPASALLKDIQEQNPSATATITKMHENLERAQQCMLAAQSRDKLTQIRKPDLTHLR